MFLMRHIPQRSLFFSGNAKAIHKHKKRKINIPFKYSNNRRCHSPFKHCIQTLRFGCASCLCGIFCTYVYFTRVHVYQYSHACIFVCNIVYLQSMAENWCSLWHSLIGQSPLLQGGIMADWVCTKAGEEKGESREKERKWKHVCKKNPIRVTRRRLFTHWDKINPALGCICIKGSRKAEFTN